MQERWTPWVSRRSSKRRTKIVRPHINKAIYESACAVGEEEVLTLRPEEQGSCAYVKDPEGKMRTAFDGRELSTAVSGPMSVNQGGRVDRHARTFTNVGL